MNSPLSITCIGTGYVGLVTGACLAELGHKVTCLDIDHHKIQSLNKGIPPIFEQGLEDLITKHHNKRLFFTSNYEVIRQASVVFLAVGTPSQKDGSVDLSFLRSASKQMALHLSKSTTVVIKSTVPVGTNRMISQLLRESAPCDVDCHVVSNPEFLREGRAIHDFMNPDRIIVGARKPNEFKIIRDIYQHFVANKVTIVESNPQTAELIKYASNAFLATKIAFINEMADLSRACHADVEAIRTGMGLDHRIGPEFLNPGPGYGGSCFPKDTYGLAHIAKSIAQPSLITEAVIQSNQRHQRSLVDYIATHVPKKAQLSIWGLTFKADTDDTRESPAVEIAKQLIERGFSLRVFDPMSERIPQSILSGSVSWCASAEETTEASDAVIVLTEWQEFKTANWSKIQKKMATPRVFDLRNHLDKNDLRKKSFEFYDLSQAAKQTIEC